MGKITLPEKFSLPAVADISSWLSFIKRHVNLFIYVDSGLRHWLGLPQDSNKAYYWRGMVGNEMK